MYCMNSYFYLFDFLKRDLLVFTLEGRHPYGYKEFRSYSNMEYS